MFPRPESHTRVSSQRAPSVYSPRTGLPDLVLGNRVNKADERFSLMKLTGMADLKKKGKKVKYMECMECQMGKFYVEVRSK